MKVAARSAGGRRETIYRATALQARSGYRILEGTTQGGCAFHARWIGREKTMACNWTPWKAFPDAQRGGVIEAPVGPGVYEVRKIANGEMIAFGYSGKVAYELSRMRPSPAAPSWMRQLMRNAMQHSPSDLEYRTCPAATKDGAKAMARGLLGRRQAFFRRRLNLAWA
jgi:hypothetical protein